MSDERLRKSIKNLRAEIDRIDAGNAVTRDKMEHLLGELEDQLDHPEDSEKFHKLADRVEALIAEYEAKHPRLSAALEEILVTLSNMGI
ncbi:MAG: DUF4404 family protein [Calditrichaeota bacterium]|nr:DUF4404 family protein [Calditrichota bacterium]